jgi:hypothetical protein
MFEIITVDTTEFRCNACLRYFDSAEELRAHSAECPAAQQSLNQTAHQP